jgi:hypothetical protein
MAIERRLVFAITGVKRVVGAFDKDFAPLDETGREEGRDHADDNSLQKSRMHRPFWRARGVPLSSKVLSASAVACLFSKRRQLPKTPLLRPDDPEAECKVR